MRDGTHPFCHQPSSTTVLHCFPSCHIHTHHCLCSFSLLFAQPQVQPLTILQPPQSTHHHDEPQSHQQTPHPFPCSCPLLPNPFLFLFSLCHSTTWWWWCMVMCTHNLCVCIPPHQSHPNQTQWCLSCATTPTKKEKVILIVFDGKMST